MDFTLVVRTGNKCADATAIEGKGLVGWLVVPCTDVTHIVHAANDVLRVAVGDTSSRYRLSCLHSPAVEDGTLTDGDDRVYPHSCREVKLHLHLFGGTIVDISTRRTGWVELAILGIAAHIDGSVLAPLALTFLLRTKRLGDRVGIIVVVSVHHLIVGIFVTDTRELIVSHGREILTGGHEVLLPAALYRAVTQTSHRTQYLLHGRAQISRE